jgi:rhodanese-related sulfurtransferase
MKTLNIAFFMGLLLILNIKMQAQNTTKQPEISFDTFRIRLKQASPNAQILDPRAPEEYKLNHLVGAVNANVADENKVELQKLIDKLDKKKPVFVYGINYGGRGSALAKKLKEQNFSEVYELPGGISKWIGAGQPVESTTSAGLTAVEYKQLLTSNKLVLVDVHSKYCGTCKKVTSIVDSISSENPNNFRLVKVELFENKQLSKELNIESIPTLILYKDDKIVWQKRGFTSKADIELVIKEELALK